MRPWLALTVTIVHALMQTPVPVTPEKPVAETVCIVSIHATATGQSWEK